MVSVGDLRLNPDLQEAKRGDREIELTKREFELLEYLMRNQRLVISRERLLEEVWGLHEDTDTRAIDNFIVRLRKYIEPDPAKPRHLLTVRGVGYRAAGAVTRTEAPA